MAKKVFSEHDIQALPQRVRANFVNSLSGFKSANLVGTQSTHGVHNLATISSAFHIGANPPLMGMIMRPHTVVRDTLENIKQTGVYTINHVHHSFVKQAHHCSARFGSDISEFDAVGLTAQPSRKIAAPYVAESFVKIGLELEQISLIELNKTEMLIGKIVEVIFHDEHLLEDGYLDIESSGSVAVSGLDSYHSTKRLARFSYAKSDIEPSVVPVSASSDTKR